MEEVIEINAVSYTTNASFASSLCDANIYLAVTNLTLTGAAARRYVLPACFRTAFPSLLSLTLNNIGFNNFSVLPRNLDALRVADSYLEAPTGSSQDAPPAIDANGAIDWETFWPNLPLCTSVLFTRLAVYTSPNVIPYRVATFGLFSAGLVGSISPSLFFDYAGANMPSLSITFSNNPLLTGELPPNIFAPLGSATITTSFFFVIYGSSITGPIPSNWLKFALPPRIVINLAHNKLSGQFPTAFRC